MVNDAVRARNSKDNDVGSSKKNVSGLDASGLRRSVRGRNNSSPVSVRKSRRLEKQTAPAMPVTPPSVKKKVCNSSSLRRSVRKNKSNPLSIKGMAEKGSASFKGSKQQNKGAGTLDCLKGKGAKQVKTLKEIAQEVKEKGKQNDNSEVGSKRKKRFDARRYREMFKPLKKSKVSGSESDKNSKLENSVDSGDSRAEKVDEIEQVQSEGKDLRDPAKDIDGDAKDSISRASEDRGLVVSRDPNIRSSSSPRNEDAQNSDKSEEVTANGSVMEKLSNQEILSASNELPENGNGSGCSQKEITPGASADGSEDTGKCLTDVASSVSSSYKMSILAEECAKCLKKPSFITMDHDMHDQEPKSEPNTMQKKKKTGRGPSKGIKPIYGVQRVLEWDKLNRPIGRWVKAFKAHLGGISRANVSILIKDWKQVPQGIKDTLWEDAKREFQIEEEPRRKQVVLSTCDRRWRDFKAKLVSGWISCTRTMSKDKRMPYVLYDFISEDVWNEFVKSHTTDEFKEISKKARKSASLNLYPHHMGQNSYAEMNNIWRRKGYIRPSSSSSSSTLVLDRTYAWLLARSVEDDKGNFYLPDKQTQEVKYSIDEWRQKSLDGEFVPDRRDDILSRALGKLDHSGRVLGFGGGVGHKVVFGTSERKSAPWCDFGTKAELKARVTQMVREETKKMREETIREIEKKLDDIVKEKFMMFVKQFGIHLPSQPLDTDNVRSNTQNKHSSSNSGEIDSFKEIREPISCCLMLLMNDSEKVIVAKGTIYPELVLDHHKNLHSDHVRVSVDDYDVQYEDEEVPVPSTFIKKLGQAHGTFTQWPKQLLLFSNDEEIPPKKNVAKKQGDNGKEVELGLETDKFVLKSKKHFLMEYALQNLSEKCNYLRNHLSSRALNSNMKFFGGRRTFSYAEDKDITVTHEDITQLLTGAWLDVSILQVFLMACHEWCIENGVNSIGFMCPAWVSATMVFSDADRIMSYMTHAMGIQSSKQFIMCPYHEKHHWILLVLCLNKHMVYIFDPIKKKRNLAIKVLMSNAFRSHTSGGHSMGYNLNWTLAQCPQQIGSRECGYYVMRYIYDIVQEYHNSEDLAKDFSRTTSYSKEELNEVRDIWAEYFLTKTDVV